MEYVEFFFGNFWHWLGGAIYLSLIASALSGGIIRIIKNVKKE